MRKVRLFVSSPSDVLPERERVQWVADRLNGEFAQKLHFDTIRWETSVYGAHGSFQDQIDNRAKLADCDIVISIFWGRLGSPLSESFPVKMPDGRPYPSGTAYEVLSALEARKANRHRPEVFVFRKTEILSVPITDLAARNDAVHQWGLLEDFFTRHFQDRDKRILRAVEKFREIGEFERKVELLLRDWIETNTSPGTKWPIEEKGSPFRGLEPFDAKHAAVYCGRDRKVLRALDELMIAARRGKPFLLIPGASGSGKSSLMRAGLAPRVVQPGLVSDVDIWRIAVMRPATDGHPMLALARALFVTGDEKHDDPGGFGMALPELTQGAFKNPQLVAQLFKGTTEVAVAPVIAALDEVGKAETLCRRFERPLRANLLLLVDQLEDIFAESVTPEDRLLFANLLGALVNTHRVWLIATLRGDLYARMITDRPFVALKDICGQFDLGPPGPDELDEIVHRSAETAGLQYEERIVKDANGAEHRERLDDRLLEDAAGENTLPLLQFAFNLLFEKCWGNRRSKVLTLAAYEEIGGLDGAINQTAEIALAQLVRPGVHVHFPLEKDIEDEIVAKIHPRLETLLRKLVVPVGQERQTSEGPAERALTARILPMAEARRDRPTELLIEALLHAHILLATKSDQGSCLRIAHDRVIISWDRARTIVEKNRDFYRVKASIEHERQRWEHSKRSTAFLIPAGAQIAQAEETVRKFDDEFSPDTRSFVAISSRRARFRQRLMTAATLVFAVVAVIATGASYYATQQRDYANQQRNAVIESHKSAQQAAEGLTVSFANGLRNSEGIKVEIIEKTLETLQRLMDTLLATEKESDPETKRIRAMMHFEFTKVFQNARFLERALEEANKGLNIRKELAALPSAKREWRSNEALSYEQLGDIHREIAKNYRGNNPKDPRIVEEFAKSHEFFEKAYEINVALHTEDESNPTWTFRLSQSLVRLGDHKDSPEKKPEDAKTDYENALKLITEVVRRQPDDEEVQHELGWCFKKVAQIKQKDKKNVLGCLEFHNKALCIRRYLASGYPLNTLYKRDLAFSLHEIGTAQLEGGDREAAKAALFEALELRQQLIDKDSSQNLWLIEYADTLYQIGLCMRDTCNYEAAGGHFALAVDKLEQLVEKERRKEKRAGSWKDDRVDRIMRDANTELRKVVKRIIGDAPEKSPQLESLKKELKNHAATTAEQMANSRKQQSHDDLKLEWEGLKGSLLTAPSVQRGKSD